MRLKNNFNINRIFIICLFILPFLGINQCKPNYYAPKYVYDTGIGFSIEVYQLITDDSIPYIQVFQSDNSSMFKEPMGYFPDYGQIIKSTLIDTFEIELVLQNRNTKDFDTFNLHAQYKLIEIYRSKLK